ncbi:MAG: N-acetyltransferase [Acidobacteriia bacterium]|nr:N-acetyltransferase [Terriglobia bacterium]
MASSTTSLPASLPDTSGFVLRKATMGDIHGLLRLINGYAANGIMLPRTEFEMSENIRDFSVAYSGRQLVGCGALHFYTPTSGEVRSLAVDPGLQSAGVGSKIVEFLEKEAIQNDLHAIFAFTYVPGFFQKLGFHEIERGALPLKVWKDCVRCPKFQCCDEIAVLKALRPHPVLATEIEPDAGLVQLPHLKSV